LDQEAENIPSKGDPQMWAFVPKQLRAPSNCQTRPQSLAMPVQLPLLIQVTGLALADR